MNEKQVSLSQRDEYNPSQTDELLWWLATAEKELIRDCVVDRNRYRIIGITVLATWLFATMAWTYFFSTAIPSAYMYVPLGLFMGFIILTIDRALIKGINKNNRNKLAPFAFRGLLALTIGTFMAQPAVLYLFNQEIKLQTSLDNEKRKLGKRQELETLYAGRKAELNKEKTTLEQGLAAKYESVGQARTNYLGETDGSTGSGKIGISNIAIAKRNEYQKLEGEYQLLKKETDPKVAGLQQQITGIEDSIKVQEQQFAQLLNNGFLTRIQALQNLVKDNDALAFRYYLIVIILMLIELMPVIAKSMLPAGTYDEKVRMREDMEKDMVRHNIDREQEMKDYYNHAAMQADKAAIDEFFHHTKQHRQDKMNRFASEWNGDKHQSFDGLWQKMKKEVLSKMEN